MIDESQFQALEKQFPALANLDPKVRELAKGEVAPDEGIVVAESVMIGGKPGCVWIGNQRMLAFWKMKLFVFLKFPAQQEFHLGQLKRIEPNGTSLFIRAETDGATKDDGWEENTFVFASAEACSAFAQKLA